MPLWLVYLIPLISTLVMGACYCNNLTVSASFEISLFIACLSSCQDQVTSAQPEALGRTNRHTIIKKQLLAVLIFNSKSFGSEPNSKQHEDQD